MSHFTVIVIGNNVEDQLKPYDENIEMEPYSKGELSQEKIDRFISYYKDDGKIIEGESFSSAYARLGDDWNSNSWKTVDGVWHEYSTRNPKAQWDWYAIGGRWAGYFKVKEGAMEYETGKPGLMTEPAEPGYADSLRKGDIDFESMINKSRNEAAKMYDKAHRIIGHLPVNRTWAQMREDFASVEEARKAYWQQERPAAWQKSNIREFDFDSSPDDFAISRAEYIDNAGNRSFIPYAIVKDGKWFSKGKMGWFGMSRDDVPQHEWNKKVSEMILGLPDDTLLTLVDCHI